MEIFKFIFINTCYILAVLGGYILAAAKYRNDAIKYKNLSIKYEKYMKDYREKSIAIIKESKEVLKKYLKRHQQILDIVRNHRNELMRLETILSSHPNNTRIKNQLEIVKKIEEEISNEM